MNTSEFERRLTVRAAAAGIAVESRLVPPLYGYFSLLSHWNRRINLTALPLDSPTDRTIDRLFIEPLGAAAALSDVQPGRWFDVGSGGGSPAIPFSLARSELLLTMVEVRERKAAFLKTVVRELKLSADVAVTRFENLPARNQDAVLVTARGVRTSPEFWAIVDELVSRNGVVALFGGAPPSSLAFNWSAAQSLAADPASYLFRGTRPA